MKKLLSMLAVLSFAVTTHAAVGTNNFTISIGGALDYTTATPNMPGLTDEQKKQNTQEFLGGGYVIELGHLYLKDMNNFVHGLDTRLSVGQNFNPVYRIGGESVELGEGNTMSFNTVFFTVGTTYQFGFKNQSGRLMLDVLGLDLGYLGGSFDNSFSQGGTTFNSKQSTGSSFLLGINLPLGMNYIFNNGLMLGFRHSLNFAFGSEYTLGEPTIDGNTASLPATGSAFGTGDDQFSNLNYNLTFSIGYAFGK